MTIIWTFTDDGFISIVEFMPPTTKTVKAAVYKTIKPRIAHWDPDQKKTIVEQELEQELVSPAVIEYFTDPIIEKLVDYTPGTYETKNADGTVTEGKLCSHLLVRARVEADLEPLKAYDANAIAFEDKTADYQFRLVILRSALAKYTSDKVMGIDYNSHVKETIEKRAPKVKGGRYTALSAIWTACAKWQPISPWGGSHGLYGSNDSWKDTYSTSKWNTKYDSNKDNGVSDYRGTSTYSGSKDALPKASRGNEATLAGLTGSKKDDGADSLLDVALANFPQNSDDDVDNPWATDEWWETEVAHGRPTRATLVAQVTDYFAATGEGYDFNVENSVDVLIEQFGVCDLDSIEPAEFWDVMDTTRLSTALGTNV